MRLFFKIIILIFISINVYSETLKITVIKESRDWVAARSDIGDKRTCFILSAPKSSKGNYNKDNRGKINVYVTHGPDRETTNVVSVEAGYNYQEQSNVTFKIDNNKPISLVLTQKDRAWAESDELDSLIVSQMKSGNKLVVTGTSSRGTKTVDTYSLFGFTAALDLIDKACGR